MDTTLSSRRFLKRICTGALVVGLALIEAGSASAQSQWEWTGASDRSWINPANWDGPHGYPDEPPDGASRNAVIGTVSGDDPISLDDSVIVRHLHFGNPEGGSQLPDTLEIVANTSVAPQQPRTLSIFQGITVGEDVSGIIRFDDGGGKLTITLSGPPESGDKVFEVGPAARLEFAPSVVIQGNSALRKTGNGVVSLSGSNRFAGGFYLEAGIVEVLGSGNPGLASGAFGTGTVTLYQGMIRAMGASQVYYNAIDLNAGEIIFEGETQTISGEAGNVTTLGSGTTSLTVNAELHWEQTLTGEGTLQISGTREITLYAANDYTGGTILESGTLTLGESATLGNSSGALHVLGGVLDLNGNSLEVATHLKDDATVEGGTIQGGDLLFTDTLGQGLLSRGGTINANLKGQSAILTVDGGATYLGGNNELVAIIVEDGALHVTNQNALSEHGLIANGGLINLGGATQSGTLSLNGAIIENGQITGIIDATEGAIDAEITGNATLYKSGPGQLTLTASNSYTGGTVLEDGILLLSGEFANLGSSSGDVRIENGILDLGGRDLLAGSVTLNGGSIINGTLSASSYDFGQSGGTTEVDANLSGASSVVVTSGTVVLTGSNSYSGATEVGEGGTLVVGNEHAVGSGPRIVTISSNGRLVHESGFGLGEVSVELTGSAAMYEKVLAEGELISHVAPVTSGSTTARLDGGTVLTGTSVTVSYREKTESTQSDILTLDGLDGTAFILVLQVAKPTDLSLDSRLYWEDPVDGVWKLATLGNHGEDGGLAGFYQMSHMEFLANYGPWNAETMLGAYGVDIATGSVWAVVDHNSDFAVVPEASTGVLFALTLGAGVLIGFRRRRFLLQ